MPDDMIGIEWAEYDPKTGQLKTGVAWEDGSGWHSSKARLMRSTPSGSTAFPDGVELNMKVPNAQ